MIDKNHIDFLNVSNDIIIQGDSFAYFLPNEKLKPWISNYTISFPKNDMLSENYTVVPHGSATLVFYYNHTGVHSKLFGPSTLPQTVGKIANECFAIMIIEFQPAGLFAFTGLKQDQLTDKITSFDLLDHTLDCSIKEIFKEATSVNELLINLEIILQENLLTDYPVEFHEAMLLIIQHLGNISSKELARRVNYSDRHLNRLFKQFLGLNMKSFSRLVRINKAITLINDKNNSLNYVCHMSGFYDMSHFIKDFKAVCGITPHDYRKNMSDFYSEIAKF